MLEEESFVILGSCSQPSSRITMPDEQAVVLQTENAKKSITNGVEQLTLNENNFGSITKALASAAKPLETSGCTENSEVDVWQRSAESIVAKALLEPTEPISIGRDVWKRSIVPSNDYSTISNGGNGEQRDDVDAVKTTTPQNNGAAGNVNIRSQGDIPKILSSLINSNEQQNVKNNDTTKNDASGKALENSLAVSFIMGQVPADSLKASIHSQFPSVSLQECEELTTVMADYLKMKDLILQVNNKMNTWLEQKNMMHSLEQENRQKLQQCQEEIGALRNENLKLKHELDEKVEQLTAFDTVRKIEQQEMVKVVSEKSALIENMRAQIEKLETKQLETYEDICKNGKKVQETYKDISKNGKKAQETYEDISKDGKKVHGSEKSEYVTRLEHERVLKDFERNMSKLLAEKLEIADMQKQYIEEINCLKENLNTSEDLVKQLQTDIYLLKSKDAEKAAQFVVYSTQRDQMSEEIAILREQVDVYTRDFELERNAREQMAGEKAQLLDDLRALQRVNQKLTEQVENHERAIAALSTSSTSSSAAAAETAVASASTAAASAPMTAAPAAMATATATTASQSSSAPQSGGGAAATAMQQSTTLLAVPVVHLCPICEITCCSLTRLQEHVNQCLDRSANT